MTSQGQEKGKESPGPKSDSKLESSPPEPPEGFDMGGPGFFFLPMIPRGRLQKFPWFSDCGGKGYKQPAKALPPSSTRARDRSPSSERSPQSDDELGKVAKLKSKEWVAGETGVGDAGSGLKKGERWKDTGRKSRCAFKKLSKNPPT